MDINELSALYDQREKIGREVETLKGLKNIQKHRPDTTGVIARCIADLQISIEEKRKKYHEQHDTIIEYLAGIKDARIRVWLTLHYAEAMTWHEVKLIAGAGNTADSIKHACYRYLREYKK